MAKVQMPVEDLNKIISDNKISGEELDLEILAFVGFYIVKNVFKQETIHRYKNKYDEYKVSQEFNRTPFHLTEVLFELNHPLSSILSEDDFKKFAKNFYNGNVGLYNIRIVKKDNVDVSPVFLHQDIGYQYGQFDRYSLFVPLTNCSEDNGGLTFYPGSHKFGYLGDAGEIIDVLPEKLIRFTPTVQPTDIIVMNSLLWHKSGKNNTADERVYYDIHINSADDTASKMVVLGQRNEKWQFDYSQDVIFSNSRLQRIKKLYEEINSLKLMK